MGMSADEVEHAIHEQFRAYRATLQDDRRHLLERFQVVDVARKVVGVGSVGTRAFIVLLQGRDQQDPLFLQVKEATRSVLEDHLPKSRYRQPGEPVGSRRGSDRGALRDRLCHRAADPHMGPSGRPRVSTNALDGLRQPRDLEPCRDHLVPAARVASAAHRHRVAEKRPSRRAYCRARRSSDRARGACRHTAVSGKSKCQRTHGLTSPEAVATGPRDSSTTTGSCGPRRTRQGSGNWHDQSVAGSPATTPSMTGRGSEVLVGGRKTRGVLCACVSMSVVLVDDGQGCRCV